MKYLLLDTNIFICCALLTKENHDLDAVTTLRRVLDESRATLLLPEVVQLEYERKRAEVLDQVRTKIRDVKNRIEQVVFPPYLGNEKTDILRQVDDLVTQRERNQEQVNVSLGDIFSSPNVVSIPITPDVLVAAYRRTLRGRKPADPKAGHLLSADCVIVESAASYLLTQQSGRLIFCSDNHSDFGKFDQDAQRHILHPDIDSDFPGEVIYYRSLYDMLQAEFSADLSDSEEQRYEETAVAVRRASSDELAAQADPQAALSDWMMNFDRTSESSPQRLAELLRKQRGNSSNGPEGPNDDITLLRQLIDSNEDSWPDAQAAAVELLADSKSFDRSNTIIRRLLMKLVDSLSDDQVTTVLEAFVGNDQVNGSFAAPKLLDRLIDETPNGYGPTEASWARVYSKLGEGHMDDTDVRLRLAIEAKFPELGEVEQDADTF